MTEEENPLGCLHINRSSADAAQDEYAAEYWANLEQQKADNDARRGVKMPVSYYVKDAVRRYQISAWKSAFTERNLHSVGAGRWEFWQFSHGRFIKATEPNGKTHLISANEIGSTAMATLLQSMVRDLTQ